MDEEFDLSTNELSDNVFSNVLTKLQNLQYTNENEASRRHILSNGATFFEEFIILLDKNTVDNEIFSKIEKTFQTFIQLLDSINMHALFKADSVFTYDIFYLYIRLLNLPGMKILLKRSDTENYTKLVYEQLAAIILFCMTATSSHAKFTVFDLQESHNNQEILLLLLNYIKSDFESDLSLNYTHTTQLILTFLWSYSDKTIVVPNLIKTGYPEAILKWLTIVDSQDKLFDSYEFVSSEKYLKSNAIHAFISIIHNTSRHDDGITVLNSLEAISVIKKVQNSTTDPTINLLCSMSLALLLTPKQIKNDRKRMNNVLDQLLKSVSDASKSEDYKDGGFHISEPLVVLVKLFNDDRALDYILQHAQVELDASSTVDFFIELLLKFNSVVKNEKDPLKQLTCTAVVNILWSISFQEHNQYKRQLKNNQKLCKLLEELFNNTSSLNDNTQYVPKYIENIQTAAVGILLNVNEGSADDALVSQSKISIADNMSKSNSKPMIMISYSHDDKVLCYQLEEELKRTELYDVWIDKNYCTTGDSWERIADGIKQADVVLCLITKNYTSKSVRREVIYAIDKLEKTLLPVFILKPDVPSWLEIRTCDLTHIRFTDEDKFEPTKITKLMETLQQLISGSSSENNSPPVHHELPILTTQARHDELFPSTTKILLRKSIISWDKADIKQWINENEIMIELYNICQFIDGSELLSFAKVLQDDEKVQYKSYAEEFSKRYNGKSLLLHQFNKFANCLRKLINEHSKQTAPIQLKTKRTEGKSQTCEIL
ncbi:unnamed protein product [Adineta steineri]|uniref:TIR domain-containing protein n=1 Tax=Adineta steineri TaxID=433720 RepID=A0A815RLZ8_9BILA|nr:unnamed protein product [Adineta steineri]CAF4055704.1 unnamed protein product [Adineta steineri]